MKIAIGIALLALAGCAEYEDPAQAAIRAHMLQNDRDTQYMVDNYKAQIASMDKLNKDLDKISDSYTSDIERMQKETQETEQRKAELERLGRLLDKRREQENQDQQPQPQAPQTPNPQTI
jgi:N-methylhydantoinase B/oxoprolinase/acetone carboxylase alpha subunit